MKQSYAEQYGTVCVIIVILDNEDTDADAIMEWALQVGAHYEEDGDTCYVLDWPTLGRSVGPELFTETAIRRTLRRTERGA